MVVAVVLLAEWLLAVVAAERLFAFMHLLDMLLHISLLRECFGAAGVRAGERPVLGVRAHVVHELRWVGHDAVAEAAKLALEEFEIARVPFEAFENKHNVVGALWDLLPVRRHVLQVEVFTGDAAHVPVMLHFGEFFRQFFSKLLREYFLDRQELGPVEQLAAARELVGRNPVHVRAIGRPDREVDLQRFRLRLLGFLLCFLLFLQVLSLDRHMRHTLGSHLSNSLLLVRHVHNRCPHRVGSCERVGGSGRRRMRLVADKESCATRK